MQYILYCQAESINNNAHGMVTASSHHGIWLSDALHVRVCGVRQLSATDISLVTSNVFMLPIHSIRGFPLNLTPFMLDIQYLFFHQSFPIYSLNVLKPSQHTLFCSISQISYNITSLYFLICHQSMTVTSHILLKHHISTTFNLFLPAIPIVHVSAQYNAIGSSISLLNFLFAWIPSDLHASHSSPHLSYFIHSRLHLYIYSFIHSNMRP